MICEWVFSTLPYITSPTFVGLHVRTLSRFSRKSDTKRVPLLRRFKSGTAVNCGLLGSPLQPPGPQSVQCRNKKDPSSCLFSASVFTRVGFAHLARRKALGSSGDYFFFKVQFSPVAQRAVPDRAAGSTNKCTKIRQKIKLYTPQIAHPKQNFDGVESFVSAQLIDTSPTPNKISMESFVSARCSCL